MNTQPEHHQRVQSSAQPLLTRRSLLVWSLPAALVPVLAACASSPQPKDDQAAVLERARTYWAATLVNDLIAAWPLEDASLDPRWTLQAYLKRGGIAYEAAEVKGIKSLEGDQAVVDVEIRFSIPQFRLKSQVSLAADRWRNVNGIWYHVLGRNSLFDQSK